MAIQLPDPGTGVPADQTGDSPWLAMKKVAENFSDPANAASRLVGTAPGNVPEFVGSTGLAGSGYFRKGSTNTVTLPSDSALALYNLLGSTSSTMLVTQTATADSTSKFLHQYAPSVAFRSSDTVLAISASILSNSVRIMTGANAEWSVNAPKVHQLYSDKNTTIVNGSLKPSSPVVKIHTDSLELNDDAERMGVTLNKRGVGDYLLQNTTGLRNDGGWRIELPQDVNGNPYFAVDYNELENNDIEVKTYKRIFDMNTFMFVPDFDNPVDIKEGRSIAIRFNDLPLDDLDDTQMEV